MTSDCKIKKPKLISDDYDLADLYLLFYVVSFDLTPQIVTDIALSLAIK